MLEYEDSVYLVQTFDTSSDAQRHRSGFAEQRHCDTEIMEGCFGLHLLSVIENVSVASVNSLFLKRSAAETSTAWAK